MPEAPRLPPRRRPRYSQRVVVPHRARAKKRLPVRGHWHPPLTPTEDCPNNPVDCRPQGIATWKSPPGVCLDGRDVLRQPITRINDTTMYHTELRPTSSPIAEVIRQCFVLRIIPKIII